MKKAAKCKWDADNASKSYAEGHGLYRILSWLSILAWHISFESNYECNVKRTATMQTFFLPGKEINQDMSAMPMRSLVLHSSIFLCSTSPGSQASNLLRLLDWKLASVSIFWNQAPSLSSASASPWGTQTAKIFMSWTIGFVTWKLRLRTLFQRIGLRLPL